MTAGYNVRMENIRVEGATTAALFIWRCVDCKLDIATFDSAGTGWTTRMTGSDLNIQGVNHSGIANNHNMGESHFNSVITRQIQTNAGDWDFRTDFCHRNDFVIFSDADTTGTDSSILNSSDDNRVFSSSREFVQDSGVGNSVIEL